MNTDPRSATRAPYPGWTYAVRAIWARWPLLLGVAFVVVVLFFRGGVVEAWARFWTWRAAHPATRADASR